MNLDKLTQPFPPNAVKWRWADRAQTRKLDYVEGHTVIHRLNDATENKWSFTVDKIERFPINDSNTLVMAYVTLEIPGLGSRSHIGVQAVNDRGGEDLVKGAVTDALKKAATLFGVGLELYGPDYEGGETAGQTGQQTQAAPPRARTTTQNTVPAEQTPPDDAKVDPWTAFWNAARGYGLSTKREVEAAIGVVGPDAKAAKQRLDAWAKDNAHQKAMVP